MWLTTLRQAVETYTGKGATLIVAVSGGGDSVALLHGLQECRESLNLRLVVAHLDHALRPESAADAAFVGTLAAQSGMMCLRERMDVAAWAAQAGKNIEESARHLRYIFLEQAARAVGATAIVVAHTQDDQAETVLMHLMRGAGLEGLKGMAPYGKSFLPEGTMPLLRPLLTIDRATLRTWLSHHGYDWLEDRTNSDIQRFRSAVRHRFLPLLEEASPRLRERLARTATLLSADAELLHHLTEQAWQWIAKAQGERVHLARKPFLVEPHAIQRRLLRLAYSTIQSAGQELSGEQVDRALSLIATGAVQQTMTMPGGIVLTIAHDGIWVGAPLTAPVWEAMELPIKGSVEIGDRTLTIREAYPADLPKEWSALPSTVAFLDGDALALPLTVRPPQPEEQWHPFGMDGQAVSLREWFSKQKVPHYQRAQMPLVVDARNNVLWVVGWRTAHTGRVTSATTRLLRLEVSD